MRRLAVLIAALTLAPAPTLAQQPTSRERAAYAFSVGAVLATGAADVATTHRAVTVYGAAEANPILRKRDGTPSYVRKVAIVAADLVLVDRLLYRRGHPRLAVLVNLGVAAVQTWAAAHNHRIVRELEGLAPPVRARLRFAYARSF
jgi:hypothetical protein